MAIRMAVSISNLKISNGYGNFLARNAVHAINLYVTAEKAVGNCEISSFRLGRLRCSCILKDFISVNSTLRNYAGTIQRKITAKQEAFNFRLIAAFVISTLIIGISRSSGCAAIKEDVIFFFRLRARSVLMKIYKGHIIAEQKKRGKVFPPVTIIRPSNAVSMKDDVCLVLHLAFEVNLSKKTITIFNASHCHLASYRINQPVSNRTTLWGQRNLLLASVDSLVGRIGATYDVFLKGKYEDRHCRGNFGLRKSL